MNFKLKHIQVIDSTNNELMNNYIKYENYTVLSADHQTNGRGRLDRVWEDNRTGSLMFSILLKNILRINDVCRLNYTVCASIIDTLRDYGVNSEFKWPNDILVNNKKISGVLIETKIVDNEVIVVVGQGINVNNVSRQINDYIFISDIVEFETDKNQLLNVFLDNFKKYFLNEKAFDLCREKHSYYNKEIIIDHKKYIVGDILIDGAIILKDIHSNESRYFGSELSLSKKEIFKDE